MAKMELLHSFLSVFGDLICTHVLASNRNGKPSDPERHRRQKPGARAVIEIFSANLWFRGLFVVDIFETFGAKSSKWQFLDWISALCCVLKVGSRVSSSCWRGSQAKWVLLCCKKNSSDFSGC